MAHLVDNYRFEVIAKAPPIGQITRLVGETVTSESGASSGDVLVDRLGLEVLAQGPIIAGVTRLVGEGVIGESGASTGDILVDRIGREVIGSQPAEAGVTRLVGEGVIGESGASTGDILVDRVAYEVLGARFLPANICPDPPELGFFAHNWADALVLETEYLTSICRAPESVAEERWLKRERPTRTVRFTLTEEGNEGANFRNTNLHQLLCILENSTAENYKIPLYSDQVCVTADEDENVGQPGAQFTLIADISQGRYFVGAQIVVVEIDYKGTPTGNFVYRTIVDKVSSNELLMDGELTWDLKANRAVIMPVICTEPALKFKISQHHCKLWQLDLEFEEVTGPEALPPVQDDIPPNFDQYRGIPILRPRHDYNQPLNIELVREGQVQTIGRGKSTYSRGAEPRRVYPLRYVENRDIAWDYIRFFDTRKGRARSFWFVDQSQTLEIVAVDGTFVDFNPVGDFAKFQEQVQGQFIGFELKDGTTIVRQVVTVQEILGVFRCTTVETTGFSNLDPTLIVYAGRAFASRFRRDSMTERWTGGTRICRFELEVITLLDENPYDLSP